jgi:hypothetical protein
MAETRLKRATGIGWQTFDGVAVLLNPHRDLVHEFNPTGTWIWERLDGRVTHSELVQGLLAAFDTDEATAESDVTIFETELRDLGLVEAIP